MEFSGINIRIRKNGLHTHWWMKLELHFKFSSLAIADFVRLVLCYTLIRCIWFTNRQSRARGACRLALIFFSLLCFSSLVSCRCAKKKQQGWNEAKGRESTLNPAFLYKNKKHICNGKQSVSPVNKAPM
jgi:hypothetical protein